MSSPAQAHHPGMPFATALILGLSVVLPENGAAAPPSDETSSRRALRGVCAESYEGAQEARIEGRLRAAREKLLVCIAPTCPAFMQNDCSAWLGEVEAAMPSLVISARDRSGAETFAVRVEVDDRKLLDGLDGRAVALDPGPRIFRFELAGHPTIERKVVIRQGEKNRLLEVDWSGQSPKPAPEVDPRPGPLRPYAYMLGGVAATGLLSFGAFGIIGRGQENQIRRDCERGFAEGCSTDKIDQAERLQQVADVSLAVGVAALIGGTTLFILSEPSRSEERRMTVGVDWTFGPTGGAARLRGRF